MSDNPFARKPRSRLTRAEERAAWEHMKSTVIPAYARVLRSGAGLQADKQLREYMEEFNNRRMRAGPVDLPTSAIFAGAFFREGDRLNEPPLMLLPERDHIASLTDFIDYVTSSDFDFDGLSHAQDFPEGEILSYTYSSPPREYSIAGEGEFEFYPVSFSATRRDDLIYIILVGGMERTDAMQAAGDGMQDYINSEEMREAQMRLMDRTDDGRLPDTVAEDSELTKVVFGLVYDSKNRAIVNRWRGIDAGPAYSITTDDMQVFEGQQITDEQVQTVLNEAEDQLSLCTGTIDFCITCLALPAYFAFKYTLIRDTAIPTKNAIKRHREQGASEQALRRVDGVRFRKVSSLEIVDTGVQRYSERGYSAPEYRVQVAGFWRSLREGQVGRGPDGEPVEGKTWVQPHSRWKDKPEKPREVLVKSRLSSARLKLRRESHRQDIDASQVAVEDLAAEAMYEERRKLTSTLRFESLARDGFKCRACGVNASKENGVKLEVDHITPVSKGGKTVPDNLQVLCSRCNRGKSDREPSTE